MKTTQTALQKAALKAHRALVRAETALNDARDTAPADDAPTWLAMDRAASRLATTFHVLDQIIERGSVKGRKAAP